MPLLPRVESGFAGVLLGLHNLPEGAILHGIVRDYRDVLGGAIVKVVVHPMGAAK